MEQGDNDEFHENKSGTVDGELLSPALELLLQWRVTIDTTLEARQSQFVDQQVLEAFEDAPQNTDAEGCVDKDIQKVPIMGI